jgi:general secretion pathway protein G
MPLAKPSGTKPIVVAIVVAAIIIAGTIAGIEYQLQKVVKNPAATSVNRGRVSVAKTQIAVFDQALVMFNEDVGRYPTEDEGLAALLVAPVDATGWNGPYLARLTIPLDPWKHPYHYAVRTTDQASECIVYSYGSDNQKGGSGPAADIVSRRVNLDDWERGR